jgi:ribonuclease HII
MLRFSRMFLEKQRVASVATDAVAKTAAAVRGYEVNVARRSCRAEKDFPQEHVHIIGVDDVGTGAIAGISVAAAAYIPPDLFIPGLCDSKLFKSARDVALRNTISDVLWFHPRVHFHIAYMPAADIAEVGEGVAMANLLEAAFYNLAPQVRTAIEATLPEGSPSMDSRIIRTEVPSAADAPRQPLLACIVDGNNVPQQLLKSDRCFGSAAVHRADLRCPSVAAASIIAKTFRDRVMCDLHAVHPEYGFDVHKGYDTDAHFQAIEAHGPCPEHRLVGRLRRYVNNDFRMHVPTRHTPRSGASVKPERAPTSTVGTKTVSVLAPNEPATTWTLQ